MSTGKNPSANDFLAAARKQAQAQPREALQKTRRETLEDFLTLPLPAYGAFGHQNAIYQRLRARLTLALGDIIETLESLPAKKGQKFMIETKIHIEADRSDQKVYASATLRGEYGSAASRKARRTAGSLANPPVFELDITANDDSIQNCTVIDYSQQVVTGGQLRAKRTTTDDMAEVRKLLGAAIANIAPDRLDDIATAIAGNPHPLDTPAAIQKDMTVRLPKHLPWR